VIDLRKKMSLSKPTKIVYSLIGLYLERLYSNPLRTKAVTSCIIAALGNVAAQKLSGVKKLNEDSVLAFALFGLLIGGPIPHYFYTYVELLVKSPLGLLLIERLIFTPCFQAIALYLLAIFEGKPHKVAYGQMRKLYLPTLMANMKYLTLIHYINMKYVPPMLRVLMLNFVGFVWVIYLANKQAKVSSKEK
jgi:peroxisomal membrane protein 2